ncbi:RusA family crossover junction endodeoxyribonuclease [Thermoactinomyces sp. DSM 45892]|uniref:RusA family crossover junction endodeoxyribonuclease n=1 Tax=Thermoactinomyces sp. DSM 45892 TaxID=1882753 RepID=UPI0008951085|nr:RusA family crossover junction endodeoxyribonuclease [Thermoactinomyces sp. DSM 45892]SDY71194.1 Endodeoxyribonuclease RusA [Thermoactinomyces sp. DSM 45892]
MLHFTIKGRAVPYTRMTRRGKYVRTDAQRYLAYQEVVQLHARQAMAKEGWQCIPKKVPIEFGCKVYLKGGLDGDLSNYVKGIEDALNRLVYEDDRYIVRYTKDTEKVFVDHKDDERVEVWVQIAS